METLIAAERHDLYLLVIDANVNERFRMSMLLQRLGYHLSTAASVEEATELMRLVPPAIIITDAENGPDILLRVKKEERLSKVPVVLLADANRKKDSADFSGYLEKPVEIKKLYRLIQSLVEKTPRENIRIETCLMGKLDCAGKSKKGIVTVLSEYGLFFQTDEPLPPKTQCRMELQINEKTINADAVVLYAHTLETAPLHEPGMGMKFLSIDPKDRALIWSYILEHLEEGITRLDR